MEPPKLKVQGYLSFRLYLHNRVELYVKLYLYMSVYINQFSNIVKVPDLLLLKFSGFGIIGCSHRTSQKEHLTYSDQGKTVRSMVRHVEQKMKTSNSGQKYNCNCSYGCPAWLF